MFSIPGEMLFSFVAKICYAGECYKGKMNCTIKIANFLKTSEHRLELVATLRLVECEN